MKLTRIALFFLTTLLPFIGIHAEDEARDAQWDISNPPGDTVEIDIDTREGSWMSVDVSPDGSQLVFDLLGDIFLIPVAGGEATALISGMAWDMQPRFSPDGTRIAFISDRDGAENLWTMNIQDKALDQITSEDFRLVHNPAWSPDGDYIAVRKHFTRQRSLGAGEIWLYHVAGGKGIQLVDRQTDQKDINEPAFSPDGRFLYYSQDTTPGPYFEYNKNPHSGIYSINRLDQRTGETRQLAGGPGGAVRPTPSPDGTSLAFVRRVGKNTVLFIKDLNSGIETPVFDKLDRDNQETWAIHGLFPTMAWLPESNGLVFWSAGKLNRLDLVSNTLTDIPFHVKKTESARKTVRFETPVAPEQVDVKMLRWVSVAPDGNSVIYSALGHLYRRDLPDGEPVRLTEQNDHYEIYPSFSSDGSNIVYVSWNDAELGAVRVMPASGGRGEVITSDPGHYAEPAFSPDGRAIRVSSQNVVLRLRNPEHPVVAAGGRFRIERRFHRPSEILEFFVKTGLEKGESKRSNVAGAIRPHYRQFLEQRRNIGVIVVDDFDDLGGAAAASQVVRRNLQLDPPTSAAEVGVPNQRVGGIDVTKFRQCRDYLGRHAVVCGTFQIAKLEERRSQVFSDDRAIGIRSERDVKMADSLG